MPDLNYLRDEIDSIDKQIVDLFENRMDICKQVAEYKITVGKPVLDPERERQKLNHLGDIAHNDINRQGVTEIFRQIMAVSRKIQYGILQERGVSEHLPFTPVKHLVSDKVKVVFQGIEGAYSNIAMCEYFGEEVDSFHVDTWDAAMDAVKKNHADFAVLPIENSSAGCVDDVFDLLTKYDNVVVGEVFLPVKHALLGLPGATLSDIKTVYSHPQGLMQCAGYLAEKDWQQISMKNTAFCARKVREDGDPSQAAIASELSGKIYGLQVLEAQVNDNKNNVTRFIIVTSKHVYQEGANKISVCFEVEHHSGSLYNALGHFIHNNINMTNIRSRAITGKTWEYRFYVDFEGDLSDPAVQNALFGLKEDAKTLKILGNY